MSQEELPHTRGCLVCGRDNPHGLQLHLHVDETGTVSCSFTPGPEHIGFEGVIHGGVLAAVLDEAMVWAATWAGKRFCVCAEMTVRFRQSVGVGHPLRVEAHMVLARSRLISTEATISDDRGLLVVAVGKYSPLSPQRHHEFVRTLVDEPQTAQTALALKQRAGRA